MRVKVTATASLDARAATSTRDSLTKYPGDVVASACSLQASPATSTSTQIVTTTSTQSPVTTTQVLTSFETATATVTSSATPSPIPANVPCGQTYTDSNDETVSVLCNTGYASEGVNLGANSQPDFATCAAQCSENLMCFALQYNVALSQCTNYGVTGEVPRKNYHVKDAEGVVFLYYSTLIGVVRDS